MFLILLLIGSSFADENVLKYCSDLYPQSELSLDQIFGRWYGVEIIWHKQNITGFGGDYEREKETIQHRLATCFDIEIREKSSYDDDPSSTSRYRVVDDSYSRTSRFGSYDPTYRYLNIVWEEPGNDRVFRVKFNNTRRGFWLSSAPSNEYLNKEYNFFAGTIQVLKAVSNHLVLSFCQRLPHSELFTVILSRSPHQLMEMEILSIHNLLNRKNLATSFMKKVCNGANASALSLAMLFSSIVLYVLSR